MDTPSRAVAGGLDANLAGNGLPSGAGSPDLPAAGASQTYATDLASADTFLRDVLRATQANPDPSSWSPITSNTSAHDAMLLAANGPQTLHFDENGAVTSPGGLSQQPSPSGALTSGAASPPGLALESGAGARALPAGSAGGLASGGESPTPASFGGVYTSDLSAADPVLRQVLELLLSNSDPTTWPAIAGVTAAQNLAVFGPNGISGLHIDNQGDVTPLSLAGLAPPVDHGASSPGGSGWLLDF